jgi:hypothetical protein
VHRYLFSRYNSKNVNLWITFIQHVFDSCGFSNIWADETSTMYDIKWITAVIKQKLRDQHIQKWVNDIDNSSKVQIYKFSSKILA